MAIPSVCLSVTRVDQSKAFEVRIMQFSPYSNYALSVTILLENESKFVISDVTEICYFKNDERYITFCLPVTVHGIVSMNLQRFLMSFESQNPYYTMYGIFSICKNHDVAMIHCL